MATAAARKRIVLEIFIVALELSTEIDLEIYETNPAGKNGKKSLLRRICSSELVLKPYCYKLYGRFMSEFFFGKRSSKISPLIISWVLSRKWVRSFINEMKTSLLYVVKNTNTEALCHWVTLALSFFKSKKH